jgi:hypothetical protein
VLYPGAGVVAALALVAGTATGRVRARKREALALREQLLGEERKARVALERENAERKRAELGRANWWRPIPGGDLRSAPQSNQEELIK